MLSQTEQLSRPLNMYYALVWEASLAAILIHQIFASKTFIFCEADKHISFHQDFRYYSSSPYDHIVCAPYVQDAHVHRVYSGDVGFSSP